MAIEWSGLGPELLVRLDRQLAEPLHTQLERELREAIRTGRLAVGERLPSSRSLASELGVSRGLVQECYRQLQAEGYLLARGGSATRVAPGAREPSASPPQARIPAPRLSVDFAPAVPDLASFPRADWARALRESCRALTAADLAYSDPHGLSALREVLAAYLRRIRAAATTAEHILVCAGFAQGLNLVLRALARCGAPVVAIEDPGEVRYLTAVVEGAGLRAVPVRVDEGGLDVDALSATDARVAVLTPAHQSPTGVVLAPERRRALVQWAKSRNATIVEDDYDAEFRFDREPVGAIQGLAPDRVAAIGSVSKSLAPTLRLGWIVCPPALVERVAVEKQLADRGSPGFEQFALARLIESGRYDRHLRRMRALYARRRDALAGALAEHAPDVELRGLAAGFHAVARLPEIRDELAVVTAARNRGIGLHGMSEYRSSGATSPPELVLGFGNLSEEAITRGIAAVADLLSGN
jgi:GntR family transcriptional regulator/MocR family aminotransferase